MKWKNMSLFLITGLVFIAKSADAQNSVGTACTIDADCTGVNEFCQQVTWLSPGCAQSGMCACLPCHTTGDWSGYAVGSYDCAPIVALNIGDNCTGDYYEIILSPNAQCSIDYVVECYSGLSQYGNVCLGAATVYGEGAACTADEECEGEMVCDTLLTSTCLCYYGSQKYDPVSGRCVNKDYGDPCTINDDCNVHGQNWNGYTYSYGACVGGFCECATDGTAQNATVSYIDAANGTVVTKQICVDIGATISLTSGDTCVTDPVYWGDSSGQICDSNFACVACPEDTDGVCRQVTATAPKNNQTCFTYPPMAGGALVSAASTVTTSTGSTSSTSTGETVSTSSTTQGQTVSTASTTQGQTVSTDSTASGQTVSTTTTAVAVTVSTQSTGAPAGTTATVTSSSGGWSPCQPYPQLNCGAIYCDGYSWHSSGLVVCLWKSGILQRCNNSLSVWQTFASTTTLLNDIFCHGNISFTIGTTNYWFNDTVLLKDADSTWSCATDWSVLLYLAFFRPNEGTGSVYCSFNGYPNSIQTPTQYAFYYNGTYYDIYTDATGLLYHQTKSVSQYNYFIPAVPLTDPEGCSSPMCCFGTDVSDSSISTVKYDGSKWYAWKSGSYQIYDGSTSLGTGTVCDCFPTKTLLSATVPNTTFRTVSSSGWTETTSQFTQNANCHSEGIQGTLPALCEQTKDHYKVTEFVVCDPAESPSICGPGRKCTVFPEDFGMDCAYGFCLPDFPTLTCSTSSTTTSTSTTTTTIPEHKPSLQKFGKACNYDSDCFTGICKANKCACNNCTKVLPAVEYNWALNMFEYRERCIPTNSTIAGEGDECNMWASVKNVYCGFGAVCSKCPESWYSPLLPAKCQSLCNTVTLPEESCADACGHKANCTMIGDVASCVCPEGYNLEPDLMNCYGWVVSSTTACNATCGLGTYVTMRTCDKKAGSSAVCDGPAKFTESCASGVQCAVPTEDVAAAVLIEVQTKVVTVDRFERIVQDVLEAKLVKALNNHCLSNKTIFENQCCPGKAWSSSITSNDCVNNQTGVTFINSYFDGDTFSVYILAEGDETSVCCKMAASKARKRRATSSGKFEAPVLVDIVQAPATKADVDSAFKLADSKAAFSADSISVATTTASPSGGGSGSVVTSQTSSNSSLLPVWAIAIIAVGGFLLIAGVVAIVVVVVLKKKKAAAKNKVITADMAATVNASAPGVRPVIGMRAGSPRNQVVPSTPYLQPHQPQSAVLTAAEMQQQQYYMQQNMAGYQNYVNYGLQQQPVVNYDQQQLNQAAAYPAYYGQYPGGQPNLFAAQQAHGY